MPTYLETFANKTNHVRRPFVIPVCVASLAACNAHAGLALVVVKNSRKMILADITQECFWICRERLKFTGTIPQARK